VDRAEFDKFADEYRALHARHLVISGESPEYFAEYKMSDLAAEYRMRKGAAAASPSVLDFGAGIGTSIPFLRKHFPDCALTCIDVSIRSLEIGANRFRDAAFLLFDGKTVPCAEESFDMAYAACVFHHIDHAEHVPLLRELCRVLVTGGLLAVFEHNPFNPLTVKAVRGCPFDDNARLIAARSMYERIREAGFRSADIRYRMFFPHLLRAFRPLERWMTWLPVGAQYYVLATK
jgi:ubiquinone/menaquinone biosynthesis C-methylase UbiE